MAEKKGEKGGNGLLQALSRGRKEAAAKAEGHFFLPRTHLLPAFFARGVRRRWYTHYGRKVRKQKTRASREFLASLPPPARWT